MYFKKVTHAGQLTEEYKKQLRERKKKYLALQKLKNKIDKQKTDVRVAEMKEEIRRKRIREERNNRLRNDLGLKISIGSQSSELKKLVEEDPERVLKALENNDEELLAT